MKRDKFAEPSLVVETPGTLGVAIGAMLSASWTLPASDSVRSIFKSYVQYLIFERDPLLVTLVPAL